MDDPPRARPPLVLGYVLVVAVGLSLAGLASPWALRAARWAARAEPDGCMRAISYLRRCDRKSALSEASGLMVTQPQLTYTVYGEANLGGPTASNFRPKEDLPAELRKLDADWARVAPDGVRLFWSGHQISHGLWFFDPTANPPESDLGITVVQIEPGLAAFSTHN